jgi:hypothetical protein
MFMGDRRHRGLECLQLHSSGRGAHQLLNHSISQSSVFLALLAEHPLNNREAVGSKSTEGLFLSGSP